MTAEINTGPNGGRPEGRARDLAVLCAVLLAVAISRCLYLGADPPAWTSWMYFVDEGLWSDPARGKYFFDNYFSDDFGTGYLITPAYAWMLRAAYGIAGVGIPQTRIPTVIGGLLTICAIAAVVWKKIGSKEAIFSAALLGLSPFCWTNGRVALLETLQTFFIVLSFAFWFASRRSLLGALAAGLAMGGAFLVKPSALYSGFLPIVLATLAFFWFRPRIQAEPRDAGEDRTFLPRVGMVALGMGAALAVLFVFIIIPNWMTYWPLMAAEGAVGKGNPLKILGVLGSMMMSLGQKHPVLWTVAHRSPVLIAGVWLYALLRILESRGAAGERRKLGDLEVGAVLWVLTTAFVLLGRSWKWDKDYYFVPMLPGWGILGGILAARVFSSDRLTWNPGNENRGWLYRFALWGILLFPLMLVLKPMGATLIRGVAPPLSIGDDPGIGPHAAASVFMAGWIVLLAGLTPLWRYAEHAGAFVMRRASPGILIALALVECWWLGEFFVSPKYTLLETQAELARLVPEGQTALGDCAATFFLPMKVRTARRVKGLAADGYSDPPPNPDVWERLRPRYLVETPRWDFVTVGYEAPDLLAKGYRLIYARDLGPVREDGVSRFRMELFERGGSEVGSEAIAPLSSEAQASFSNEMSQLQ